MRRVRVLNVIGTLTMGGTERYLARVAPRLKAHGVDIEVCTLERVGPLVGVLEASQIPVHSTSFAFRKRHAAAILLLPVVLRTIADVRALIRSQGYDAVHSYLFFADVIATTAARLARTPRIIESRRALHAWRHDPNLFEHSLELGCNVLAHELIANSHAVMRDVVEHERWLPRRRTVIYNGVDASEFQLARPSARGPLRLVTVGALAPRKGQVYALEAMSSVGAAGTDAVLTIVGAGPDEAMLRARTEQLALSDRVRFVGESDPRPFLASADIFMFPSRQEGFSNALLEAMASGLPCIATNAGGNSEAVVDGTGGILVPPFDSAAIAKAILSLAANRDQLATMGRANRERVEREFTLDESVRRLASWYRGEGDWGFTSSPRLAGGGQVGGRDEEGDLDAASDTL